MVATGDPDETPDAGGRSSRHAKPERRRALSHALGRALVAECSEMELEDALPGLSTVAVGSLEDWEIGDRLGIALGADCGDRHL